jgi:adenosylmethionine-8-amino-7-oxononanoate aminotransferase
MHFTRHSTYQQNPVPIIARGEGAYVWDTQGRRYLDGLAGLFVVQVGHGRRELADVARSQASDLAFFPLWSYAHPAAIDLAERLAAFAPGDLNRVFFTTGGGEAVETAWKLAKQYFKLVGKPTKYKVISRSVAYHGTPHGALSITGIPAARQAFEPLVPGAFKVPNTNIYRAPEHLRDDGKAFGLWAANRIEEAILFEGRTRWPRSSSSRCRTPAAASRRHPGTSTGSVKSATSTTCSSCPTRSSARSGGSVRCSPATTSATSRTSSPAPRA